MHLGSPLIPYRFPYQFNWIEFVELWLFIRFQFNQYSGFGFPYWAEADQMCINKSYQIWHVEANAKEHFNGSIHHTWCRLKFQVCHLFTTYIRQYKIKNFIQNKMTMCMCIVHFHLFCVKLEFIIAIICFRFREESTTFYSQKKTTRKFATEAVECICRCLHFYS